MSASLNAIRNQYVESFPADMPIKAAQGFIVTAAIQLVAGSAAGVALLGGAIAATATIIESITRPIIRAIFPEVPIIGMCIQICIPKIVAFGLAASLAPWVGVTFATNTVVLSLLAWMTLNHRFYDRNVAMAEVL